MWRGVRNWPFWPARGELGEQIFVQIALGVAILHRDLADEVDDAAEQRGRRDGEARIVHVAGIERGLAAERAQPGEEMVADEGVHLAGLAVLEAAPAEIGEGDALVGLALGEDPARLIAGDGAGFVVLQRLKIVEPADEEQIGDLLDDLQRVGNAARPERVPELVDLVAQFAGQHGCDLVPSRFLFRF